MNEAAPQAADGSTANEQALEVLRLLWEDHYLIGYDKEHDWWASRHGVPGHIITAREPGELGRMIAEEFGPAKS